MELYDEPKQEEKSKVPVIIWISIAILTILTIIAVIGIIYIKDTITIVKIDAKRNTEIEKTFYIKTEEDGTQKLYMPIIKIANFFNYEGYNGDYKNKSEDKTKCHVTCENETAMFSANSDVLIKITEDSENEYIKIDEPVLVINEELYTTIDGVQKAFNVSFAHDEEFKKIDIYTMGFLVEYYATQLKQEEYSEEFVNQKAILEGMLVVEINEQFGVLDIETGKHVLEAKYQEIEYLPSTAEFLVKSNSKYGVVTKEAATTIKTVYDEIKTIDTQNGLYLVKQNGSYGVIDTKGNVKIQPEYSQIGISDISKYTQNGVENEYVLLDGVIPVKNQEKLWAFFNIEGERLTEFKYTDIGCKKISTTNAYPAVVIPGYKIIVVQVGENYNLVTSKGEDMITGNVLGSVYLKYDTTTGENKFFMTSSNSSSKVISIEDWLTSIGQ